MLQNVHDQSIVNLQSGKEEILLGVERRWCYGGFMEIATNAVLLAVLMQATDFAKRLELPLPTPLHSTNVQDFRTLALPAPEGSTSLSCYLIYEGDYRFRHDHGCIASFSTPRSYLEDPPNRASKLYGEVRFSEDQCLTKARVAIASLGYTNVALLESAPDVTPPITRKGKIIPRYIFTWKCRLEKGEVQAVTAATVEVNAEQLTIENLQLSDEAFWREEWSASFGQSNAPPTSTLTQPKRTELQTEGMSKDSALACIRAVLPEINSVCSKLEMSLPSPIRESDIEIGESLVAIREGRPMVQLTLKTGDQVVFHKGHVWGVQTRDTYFQNPWQLKGFQESEEFLGAVKYSKRDVTDIVRKVLVEKLGLQIMPLYLNTDPVFHLVPSPTVKKGTRRYYFSWQRPETDAEREQREAWGVNPELSVSAEVDAVSGEIKVVRFWHQSLERADPQIEPLHQNGASTNQSPIVPSSLK